MSVATLLTRVFVHDIEGVEPRIVRLDRPMRLVGMATDTSLRNVYHDVPELGKRFRQYTRTNPVPDKQEPWAFAAVSKGYDREKGTFRYFMGDVVTSTEHKPGELSEFEIPAILYAVFPVRPKNRFGWPMAIANTKRYAYDVWLPKSGYQPAGVIDDFELHDERSARPHDPEVDLYVAIRERQGGGSPWK